MSFNINNYSFLTAETLKLYGGKTATQAKALLNYYEKRGKLVKIKRGAYFNPSVNTSPMELSNFLFPNSYISLGSILFEEGVMKQPESMIQSVSSISKSETIRFGGLVFNNYKISNSSQEGIFIGKDNIRKATKERALLDLLYLKLYSPKYVYDNELYLSSIDMEILKRISLTYGKRFSDYIFNNVVGAGTLNLK